MARTRAAKITKVTMSDVEILKMVNAATVNGFSTPESIIIGVSNKKTLARLYDSGLLTMKVQEWPRKSYSYDVSEIGQALINAQHQ